MGTGVGGRPVNINICKNLVAPPVSRSPEIRGPGGWWTGRKTPPPGEIAYPGGKRADRVDRAETRRTRRPVPVEAVTRGRIVRLVRSNAGRTRRRDSPSTVLRRRSRSARPTRCPTAGWRPRTRVGRVSVYGRTGPQSSSAGPTAPLTASRSQPRGPGRRVPRATDPHPGRHTGGRFPPRRITIFYIDSVDESIRKGTGDRRGSGDPTRGRDRRRSAREVPGRRRPPAGTGPAPSTTDRTPSGGARRARRSYASSNSSSPSTMCSSTASRSSVSPRPGSSGISMRPSRMRSSSSTRSSHHPSW